MADVERRLGLAGLALFLLALLQGFFIPLFDRVDVARAAHATALGSGTFLIAVGMLWPKLAFQPPVSLRWATVLALSMYAIAIGLTLSATYPAGTEAMHRTVSALVMVLNAGGAILLIASLVATLAAFKPVRA